MMKSAVFARPNLKVFLLGAILIAVVQDFIAKGRSQASIFSATGAFAPDNLDQLLADARLNPRSEVYLRISRWYERRGEIKKAMVYLHKARKLAEVEEFED
jgi:hypothetical protein